MQGEGGGVGVGGVERRGGGLYTLAERQDGFVFGVITLGVSDSIGSTFSLTVSYL